MCRVTSTRSSTMSFSEILFGGLHAVSGAMRSSTSTILVSALLLLLLSSAAAATVLDTDGNEVQVGVEYYILPAFRGRGGGLTLAARNDSCPLYVAQEGHEVDRGFPVTFSPADAGEKVLRESADTNVVFSGASICVQSMVWTLAANDPDTSRFYVATNGVAGNPGRETLSNWFRIDRFRDQDYKIVFCPGVCDICRPICGEMGVFDEDGKWWLALNLNGGSSFPVVFKRASEELGKL